MGGQVAHEHEWERYELRDGERQAVWYVGWRCDCGEQGFPLKADRDVLERIVGHALSDVDWHEVVRALSASMKEE